MKTKKSHRQFIRKHIGKILYYFLAILVVGFYILLAYGSDEGDDHQGPDKRKFQIQMNK